MNHLEQLHLDAIEKSEVNINPSHDDNMWVTDKKVAASKSAEITEQVAIEFWSWMRENDIPDNAEKYGNFTDKDMFQEFLKTKQ